MKPGLVDAIFDSMERAISIKMLSAGMEPEEPLAHLSQWTRLLVLVAPLEIRLPAVEALVFYGRV